MEEIKEDNENFDKIKVFSSEDDKLKILGELLSNKSSRDIIKLLIEKEMYTNEIATKLDMRPNLVIHHLKKLEELGLLEIEEKKIVRKGVKHRYFRMVPNLFVSPNHDDDEIHKGVLKKIFREGVKIVGVVGVTAILLFSSFFDYADDKVIRPQSGQSFDFIHIVLSIIIVGLLFYIFKKRKKD